MPSLLPRQVRWNLVRPYAPIVFGLPRISGGSAPATPFLRPAQRSPCYGLQICQVANATFYTRGFSSFVTSAAALIATGWSEPVPGRDFHPLWISAFSRRTEIFRLANELHFTKAAFYYYVKNKENTRYEISLRTLRL